MPGLLLRYKNAERMLYKKASAAISRRLRGVAAAWSSFIEGGRQSVSLLLVVHGEEPPRGLRTSLFGLAGACLIAATLVVLAFAFFGGLGGARARVSASSAELTNAQMELDSIREQAARLSEAYEELKAALGPITQGGGSHASALAVAAPASRRPDSALLRRSPEARSLAEIGSALDRSSPIVAEYGDMLASMDSVKRTVPAIWPINGAAGHISTTFGTNPNPFTGQSYFHSGIDCSTYRSGDLIVATSDGKVVFSGFEGGYGRCVIIAHAYGYMTRYGHMDRLLVHSGQYVRQGQGIGILGNSGVSTAPHVHYEVVMGRRYLDPTDYLWSGARSFPIVTGSGFSE
jgi:murein DD-endopeptidase MepM/ murein hydrolase activator NlpD